LPTFDIRACHEMMATSSSTLGKSSSIQLVIVKFRGRKSFAKWKDLMEFCLNTIGYEVTFFGS